MVPCAANRWNSIPIAAPFTLVIANSGIHSSTADVVNTVRRHHEADPASSDAIFHQIARISEEAASALQIGSVEALGPLMLENHQLLQQLGVSLPELDHLTEIAMQAGRPGRQALWRRARWQYHCPR